MLEVLVNKYLCNLDEQPLTAFEREREAQVTKNHKKMEELGVVVVGFGDTDETYSDLQDEPVALAVEVLVLPCIEFGQEGPGGAYRNAMLCCLDSNAICTCFLLKFVSPILASGSKKP